MKVKTVIYTIIAMQFLMAQDGGNFGRNEEENRNPFHLTAMPIEAIAVDSVKTVIYLEIPNSSLQFVKNDSGFQARFEATVSIKNKDGFQKGRQLWTRSVDIVDYRETVSTTLFTTLYANLVLPTEELIVSAEVLDRDTHNASREEIELDMTPYLDGVFLFPIILLKKKPGNWGIGDDMIPVMNFRIPEENDNYYLLASGKIETKPFSITVVAINNSDSVLLDNNLEYNNLDESSLFSTIMHIPQEILRDLNVHFIVSLHQDKETFSETLRLSITHPGIPATISDIELAVDQLRYILDEDDIKRFKRANVSEKEILFKEFWDKHDPTPHTVKNELMEEYYHRVRFANKQFSTFLPGWRSDMGMIYILFGAPDDIERAYSSISNAAGQIWHYYSVNRSFTFIDATGFGDYRLATPYFGETIW